MTDVRTERDVFLQSGLSRLGYTLDRALAAPAVRAALRCAAKRRGMTPDERLQAEIERLVLEAVRDCVPVGIAISVLERVRQRLLAAAPLVEAALEAERRSR